MKNGKRLLFIALFSILTFSLLITPSIAVPYTPEKDDWIKTYWMETHKHFSISEGPTLWYVVVQSQITFIDGNTTYTEVNVTRTATITWPTEPGTTEIRVLYEDNFETYTPTTETTFTLHDYAIINSTGFVEEARSSYDFISNGATQVSAFYNRSEIGEDNIHFFWLYGGFLADGFSERFSADTTGWDLDYSDQLLDYKYGSLYKRNFTVIGEETWDVSGISVDVWKVNYTSEYQKWNSHINEKYQYFAKFNGLSMGYMYSSLHTGVSSEVENLTLIDTNIGFEEVPEFYGFLLFITILSSIMVLVILIKTKRNKITVNPR